ncbi:hypothetical protein D3C76_1403300 [compost metagenome]
MLKRILKQPPESGFQFGAFAQPEIIGVRLQNVQMSVHGFWGVLILVGETQAVILRPISGEYIPVTAIDGIEAPLNNGEHFLCQVQELRTPCSENVFRNPVQIEGLAVNLLFGVQGSAQMVHHPEAAGILRVLKAGL